MINLNQAQVERLQGIFRNTPEQAKKVISREINRATASGKTQAAREARSLYTVRHGDVLKTLKVNKSTSATLRASISSRGELIPLMAFNPRSTKSGVSVAIKKGERQQLKSLFIRTLVNPRFEKGAQNVFGRVTDQRIPLRGYFGPSIPQMIGNESALERIEGKTSESLDKNLGRAIEFLLRG